jgi:hypothetical protein
MRRAGRPAVHTEPREKITVVMLDRHTVYLDVMSVLIRARHHKSLTRAEIIRALIEFMQKSGIDFTRFATATEMVAFLVAHFQRNPHRGRLPRLLESGLFDADQHQDDSPHGERSSS